MTITKTTLTVSLDAPTELQASAQATEDELNRVITEVNNRAVFVSSDTGAPTFSATKGAIYVRSDGSGTNTRAYINLDGATTWVAIVTGS